MAILSIFMIVLLRGFGMLGPLGSGPAAAMTIPIIKSGQTPNKDEAMCSNSRPSSIQKLSGNLTVAGLNLIGRRRLSKLDLGKIDFAGPEHRERNLTTLVRGTVGRAERAG